MIGKPLVAIVMPVYKVEKYIEDSINFVFRQSYKNIELIIVDDGSPDKSIQIAERLLLLSDIKYEIVRQENAGLGDARNTGMKIATGKWITFLDSDDMGSSWAA